VLADVDLSGLTLQHSGRSILTYYVEYIYYMIYIKVPIVKVLICTKL